MPYCADSGADLSVMSRAQLVKLMSKDKFVKLTDLTEEVKVKTAGGLIIRANSSIEVELKIHTAAGPVCLTMPVKCLIIDEDEDEFIIGKDVLTMLGIDVDRQLEQLVTNGNINDEDLTGCDDDFEIGVECDADVKVAIEELIGLAISNGFPPERSNELRTVAFMFDIWRLKLGGDPPAKVPPLLIRLKEGVKPQKCKARPYPPHIREFLRDFNAELERMGWVYENTRSRWASAALPVRKPGSNEFRQACDYRALNEETEPIAGVMPILRVITEHVRGMAHFGLFDFLKGFWQLPLAPECQEFLSYMTDSKVYTPTRVPQGCSDAAFHFQSTMETCFKELLYKHLLVWVDDLLLYASSVDEYLEKLQRIFCLINEFGLKLSVKKSSLYQKSVKWCGKIIDGDGVRHDPERIRSLREMPYPKTAADLQQFLCAANWLRESILGYAETVKPLQECLDTALRNKKKSKRAAAAVPLNFSPELLVSFDRVRDLLTISATLHHPSPDGDMVLVTDASEKGWSIVVTEVQKWDTNKDVAGQAHRLLTCLSGVFTGSQVNWSVIEKEAFPLVTACEKLSYLLMRPRGFRMFCDHRNLIHVFAPSESVKKHVRGKLLRWALKLSEFRYTINHIPGTHNVWADMLSRWAGQSAEMSIRRVTTRGAQQQQRCVLRPLDEESFVWPTFEEVRRAQKRQRPQSLPSWLKVNENGIIMKGKLIWIPTEEQALLRRLMIISHCGAQGHRGRHAMMTQLASVFSIYQLRVHVDKFLAKCLLCLHVKGGEIIPRPWGEAYRSKTRNEALHFDFLSMGESFGKDQYLLVLKDDASHFCELVGCESPTSAVVVRAILQWHSRFSVPSLWISDQGSHFTSEVMSMLCNKMKCDQRFSVAYCPWINGSIERLNRDVLQVFRAMILEYKLDLDHRDWMSLLSVVQCSLNHTPLPSLAYKSPLELFTGLPPPSPFRHAFVTRSGQDILIEAGNSDKIERSLAQLRASIQKMHREVSTAKEKQTLLNKKKERGENIVNFSVGDYVLRSRVDEKHLNKLLVTWVGPYVVTEAHPLYFVVRSLVTGKTSDVHASRLKFFDDSDLQVTEELLQHITNQGIVLDVQEIKQHRWNAARKDYELCISWRGLEEIEDSWEPFLSMRRDCETHHKPAENTRFPVQQVLTDNGGEFMSESVESWYAARGIGHIKVGPKEFTFKFMFWLYALKNAAYIKTRVYAKPIEGVPCERMFGKKVDTHHFRKFGSFANKYVFKNMLCTETDTQWKIQSYMAWIG
ncbi:Hypothetical protein PHPALM_13794 [Phytophthora palmivora]|uniref:Uncharacterized protein n=1 Tax=Phytophthora palmivora TaxID=4796 RepID=A0A2P4XWG1_9STRA|nr:Hypothetical protein PHPALM_13794 [Phytophthora palmivora]